MSLITVDFATLTMIAIGLFALSGFFRGWWREGFSTIPLLLLVVAISQPDLMATIIEQINQVLSSLTSGGTLLAEPLVLDPNNRNLYIGLMLFLVLISYFGSRLSLPGGRSNNGVSFDPSTGARIAGGIVGAFNGFMVVNLVKEYIVGRAVPGLGLAATAAAPSEVSVQLANVPPDNYFSGITWWFIIVACLIIIGFLSSTRLAGSVGQGFKIKEPLGYKPVKMAINVEKK